MVRNFFVIQPKLKPHCLDANGNLETRQLFTYLDYTNPSNVTLIIKSLHPSFNVFDYKIEVWRERNGKKSKMDVGFVNIASERNGEMYYYYNTWQEWGNYYFTVSPVNNICLEDKDVCVKTETPQVILGMYVTLQPMCC